MVINMLIGTSFIIFVDSWVMAYIGAQPNKQLTKTTSQSFNGTGSATAFTLNRAVNTGEELEVFVDNVQQEPGSGKSYTATGTTLTFDEAPPLEVQVTCTLSTVVKQR